MWTDFQQDVWYAFRGLRRAPGFTTVAVLTLALGIGANTAIFSVVNTALLRPLPFGDGDRLVFVWNTYAGLPEPLGPGRLRDLQQQATSFSAVAAVAHLSFTLTGSGPADRISGSSVSSAFFDVLGARPYLGEPFHTNAADRSAVVLSYALWKRRFGGDRGIIGHTITLNERPRVVIAVMAPDFFWPSITTSPGTPVGPDLWVPGGPGDVPRTALNEDADMTANRNMGYLRAVARLKPGVMVAQARTELTAVGDRVAREHPEDGGRGATVLGIRDQFFGPLERPLFVLSGIVILVLAIAGANVAGLLLGRGAARRRDLALRRALGATRARIVRQLLAETAVLSIAGAIAGLAFSWLGSIALARLAPIDFLGGRPIPLDARVVGFTVVISAACGLAFGVVPALQSSRDALSDALAEGCGRSSGSRRAGLTRQALVVLETAVAVVLLVATAMFVRSFVLLTNVDVGIDTHNLLTFEITLTGDRAKSPERRVQFYEALQDRLSQVPGVRAVGAAVTLPIGGDAFGASYLAEGRGPLNPAALPRAGYQIVSPGYFATMGIPIERGRDVRRSDVAGATEPVVLVNDTLAREAWPGADAVGKRLRIDLNGPWLRVVGVVRDIRHLGPATPPRPEIYQPESQVSFSFMAFVVRTGGDPHALVASVRRAALELDSDLPLAKMKTMDEHIDAALSRPRFLSALVTTFGLLAVTLALIGIYAMMAWSVVERRQEFAIRLALGAQSDTLALIVVGRALGLAGIGIALGLAAARAVAGIATGLLYGVQPGDPSAFAWTALAVFLVSLAAYIIPVWRAVTVDPLGLLRG